MSEKRFSNLVVSLAAAIILAAVFYFKPYFGLMDDWSMIFQVVPMIDRDGIIGGAWKWAVHDVSTWGMFRLTYPPMAYFLYKPALLIAPWVLYLLNSIFVFCLFFIWAKVWEKLTAVKSWRVLLCSLLFFYGYDLFQHPSLQEKMVLLFGASLFWLVSDGKLNLKRWSWVLIVATLGIVSKASFFIYLSGAVFVLWVQTDSLKKAFWRSLPLMILTLIGLAFTVATSRHGGYTNAYFTTERILPNLFSRDAQLILVPAFLLAGILFLRGSWKKSRQEFVPLIVVAAFFALFLPWGVAAYIQSVIAPTVGCILALLAGKIFSERRKWFWIVPCAAIGLSICVYRGYTIFARLHDLGRIVATANDMGIKDLYMPCWEGSDAMQKYLPSLAVHRLKDPDFADTRKLNGHVILFDNALCPLPGRAMAVPGCTSEKIFTGSFTKSYQVERLSCR